MSKTRVFISIVVVSIVVLVFMSLRFGFTNDSIVDMSEKKLECRTLSDSSNGGRSVTLREQLLTEIWNCDDPFNYVDMSYVDAGYPHTNILPELVKEVLLYSKPFFWLEAGSMIGGSIIRVSNSFKELQKRGEMSVNTTIVSVDPFAGDVNMVAWEHQKFLSGEWRFIRNEKGRGRIYDRFMANIKENKHNDIVIPVVVTAIVGMKSIHRLVTEKRLSQVPEVIYLDSAHEQDETLLELKVAWFLLQSGGILFGDDWAWQPVRSDVTQFAKIHQDSINTTAYDFFKPKLQNWSVQDGIFLYQGQWLLVKRND